MDSQLRIERIRAYGDRYNALGDADVADILHTLRRLNKDDKLVSQCLDFIPMRLVTLVEVKLKGFIILLIDSISSPERKQAGNLKIQLKFDYSISSALVESHLTLGTIVAHEVKFNSVENVCAVFTTLLGEDFKAKLQKAVRWVEDGDGFATEAIIADIDTVVGTLGRLYEVRHIVTHELPSGRTYDPAELDRFINSVEQFLEACEAVVDSRLWYSDAENVEQLHAYLDGDIEEWTAALSSTLDALQSRDGTDAALLRESQKIWLSFANAHAELASRYHQDWWKHVAYKLAMKTLLQERWVQLQQFPETIPIHK